MVLNAVERINNRLGQEPGLLKMATATAAEDSKFPQGWESRLVSFKTRPGTRTPTREERTAALSRLGEIIKEECGDDYAHRLFQAAPKEGLVLATYLMSKQKG